MSGLARPSGLGYWPGFLEVAVQSALVTEVLEAAEGAPFFTPTMPRTGKPFSVRMTNLGPLGWVSDQTGGYRYQAVHPQTQKPWPAMPERLLALWAQLTAYPAPPEACLVNWYQGPAKMGLHVDADEADRAAPVLSISLGDTALFRVGGALRGDPTTSMKLRSGDVVMLAGESRHAYHGIDRIQPGSSRLIPGGGRINLTMRRVTPP